MTTVSMRAEVSSGSVFEQDTALGANPVPTMIAGVAKPSASGT